MIVAISGLAGAGKDTLAGMLEPFNFVRVAFADPLKRICRDVFEFTDDQLWGPSEARNAPDPRYVRTKKGQNGYVIANRNNGGAQLEPFPKEDVHLTPRHALQTLGTEWGRACYPPIWIEYGLRVAKAIQEGASYLPQVGIVREHPSVMRVTRNVVFSDARFKNEFERIRQADGRIVRIKRGSTLEGVAAQHVSETEQTEIPDEFFDYVIDNRGTLEDLKREVPTMLRALNQAIKAI